MKFVCQKEDLMQGLSVASKASATRSPQAAVSDTHLTLPTNTEV